MLKNLIKLNYYNKIIIYNLIYLNYYIVVVFTITDFT